jgi:hypothetical protein
MVNPKIEYRLVVGEKKQEIEHTAVKIKKDSTAGK